MAVRSCNIKDLLRRQEEMAEGFPSLSVQQIGEEHYLELTRQIAMLVDINGYIKNTRSLHNYARLRRLEGHAYAELIASVATSATLQQPGYQQFRNWLKPTGEVTNLLNSLVDIKDDYKRGELAYEPSLATRPMLLGHIVLAIVQAPQTAAPGQARLELGSSLGSLQETRSLP